MECKSSRRPHEQNLMTFQCDYGYWLPQWFRCVKFGKKKIDVKDAYTLRFKLRLYVAKNMATVRKFWFL